MDLGHRGEPYLPGPSWYGLTMGKYLVLALTLCVAACDSGESVDDYNKKQAKAADDKRPKGKVIKVKTALPGGVTIACNEMLDVEKMTTLLEEKEPVTLKDVKEIGPTSVCSVRRGGEVMDAKKQEEQVKKTAKLGVLAGDELCHVTIHCSIPAEDARFESDYKNQIEKGTRQANDDIGTYACIKVTPKGPNDAYTYKFIDPDTRCVMSVRGGPSVNEEAEVQKCAKAVLDVVGPEQIASKKK